MAYGLTWSEDSQSAETIQKQNELGSGGKKKNPATNTELQPWES